jgi:hypothetical protein
VALSKGNKIEAIKIVREEMGLDLTTAKQVVDRYAAVHAALFDTLNKVDRKSMSTSRIWMIVLIVAVAITWALALRQ